MIVKNCLAIRLECPSPFTLLLVISTEMDTSMNALEKRPNAQHLERDENGYIKKRFHDRKRDRRFCLAIMSALVEIVFSIPRQECPIG
jgi:hypothetical protein